MWAPTSMEKALEISKDIGTKQRLQMWAPTSASGLSLGANQRASDQSTVTTRVLNALASGDTSRQEVVMCKSIPVLLIMQAMFLSCGAQHERLDFAPMPGASFAVGKQPRNISIGD